MSTVALLNIAERTGQGVDRAYREMLRLGKEPPRFSDDGSRVEALLDGGLGNDAFVRFVTLDLEPDVGTDVDVLLTMNRLRHVRSIAADALSQIIQRSPAQAQVSLDRMAGLGLVEATRRTSRKPFPNYVLSPRALSELGSAVTYHRRSGSGLDAKVVAHVNEYGFITNQTLQRMLDVGVFPARDLLKDLQDRGVLVKLDQRTGGRGVRYGPGKDFPS